MNKNVCNVIIEYITRQDNNSNGALTMYKIIYENLRCSIYMATPIIIMIAQ